jgi:HEAT repeat protein
MESLARVATYVQKADPHASDNVFFILTSQMAARRCMPCLPAVLKILDLEELDAYIPEHALPVNLIYGLMFTVYQYGDSVTSELVDRLDSSKCPVRANAAFALGDLLPSEIPPVLSKMVFEDSCEYARAAALEAAASFMHPDLEQLAMKRMALDAPLSKRGRGALVVALGMSGTDAAKKTLQTFTSDPDAEISKYAEKLLTSQPPDLSMVGTAPPAERSRVLRELKRALKKNSFDDTPDQNRYVAALTPEDIPLVNEARAAVLARLSDECLYEWYPLTGVAQLLRAKQRQSSAPK